MKKIWKTRKNEEGVSPVIATILMVAITVVLAAVLYVMVIEIRFDPDFDTGLTFDQEDRTGNKVSLSILTSEDDALVDGTATSIMHDGLPSQVTNVTLYNTRGEPIAWSDGESWVYGDGYSSDTLLFKAGMTIIVSADDISPGDTIKFTSVEDFYEVSKFTVK